MSFQAQVWAMRKKTGHTTTKAVLLALANYADDEGSCFPSVKRLAEDCECSTRTVIRALIRLGAGDAKKGIVGLGLLSRNRRTNARGGRASDRYFLALSDNLSPDTLSNPKCQIVTPSKDEPITEPISIKKCARDPSPRDELRKVLDEPHADAVVAHRKQLSKPLTVYAAQLLAKKLAACANANEAADEMIANGWSTITPEWMEAANKKPSNKQTRGGGKYGLGKRKRADQAAKLPLVTIVSSHDEPELFRRCERIRGMPVPVGPSGTWSFPNETVEQARRELANPEGAS